MTSNKWNDYDNRVWEAYRKYDFSMTHSELQTLADKHDVSPDSITNMHYSHKEVTHEQLYHRYD